MCVDKDTVGVGGIVGGGIRYHKKITTIRSETKNYQTRFDCFSF